MPARRGPGCRGQLDAFNRGDQPVAALGDGLDVARLLRIVAERLAQLDDRLRERVVAHDDAGPHHAQELFARDDLARPLRELKQDLDHLGLHPRGLALERKLVTLRFDRPLADAKRHRPAFLSPSCSRSVCSPWLKRVPHCSTTKMGLSWRTRAPASRASPSRPSCASEAARMAWTSARWEKRPRMRSASLSASLYRPEL